MTTITFQSRLTPPPEDRSFTYAHNARSWLLLAGYLPQTEDSSTFVNVYTGEIARMRVER